MENKFLEFVAEVMDVDVSDISMETEYNGINEWNSMMMLTLIVEIEAEYGVSIPIEKAGGIKNISDLYAFVENR